MKKSELKQIIREEIQKEIFGLFSKKSSDTGDHYVIVPKWQGKRNVKFINQDKPFIGSGRVEFNNVKTLEYPNGEKQNLTDKLGVTFYNTKVGSTTARIFNNISSFTVNLNLDEADRLRNKYFGGTVSR